MAKIVLVHGIDQQQKSADVLEASWVPALAGGVRNAGYTSLADRIATRQISTSMAFYGRLFLKPGQQGAGLETSDLDEERKKFAESLGVEWLTRSAKRSEGDSRVAKIELAYLQSTGGGELQGPKAAVRSAIASLARLRWFAQIGMGVAERFINRALTQTTLYLTEPEIREKAQRAVLDLIDDKTEIVIGHSLGSVVAYETVHKLKNLLPLLVTIGSPLGLGTIVYEKLAPEPPSYPPLLKRWVNVADRNDLVAAEPDITNMFTPIPHGSIFEGSFTVDNGSEPHSASFYLGKVNVGRPVGDTLSAGQLPLGC
jgi:hypothetical protein